MKNLLTIALLMVIGFSFVACKGGGMSGMKPAEIAAKAKAEGANWTVDQWKDATKAMFESMKPMLKELEAIKAKVDNPNDSLAALKALGELQELSKKYEADSKAMEEFMAAAEGCENGKAMSADDEWVKSMYKELGIPEDVLK